MSGLQIDAASGNGSAFRKTCVLEAISRRRGHLGYLSALRSSFPEIARVHGGFGEAAAPAGIGVHPESERPQTARADGTLPNLGRLIDAAIQTFVTYRLQDRCLGGHTRF